MSRADTGRAAPRTLGDRYRLGNRIGTGASSQVHQATDLRLGRQVAVKQLRANLTEDARFAKLFRAEAQLAAQLSHPNILTVFDWSADSDGRDGGAYIVTELLAGGSLRTVLDIEGTITPSQAALVGLQGARGLQAAHDAGLVHRDIKPANLLFGSDGRVHIGDFGIARAVTRAAWTEPQGVLIGTARYAAPEQADGGDVDAVVDVYSLAVCLFEAMTGEVPLVADNAVGTMVLRKEEDLPFDESFGPLAAPLAAAGRADPDKRCTAAQLAEALTMACRSLPEPRPLTLIDLTEGAAPAEPLGDHDEAEPHPQPPPVESNVRLGPDGELIILGEDGSDLSFPAVAAPMPSEGDGSHRDRGIESAQVSADGIAESPGAALGDRTGDDYLTVAHRRRRRWRRLPLGLAIFAVLAAAAGIGGWQLAEANRPELQPVTITLPSFEVVDYRGLSTDEVMAQVEPYRWTVTVAEEYRDGTVPGQILAQSPGPGTRMTYGNEIGLTVSLGPVPRTVPTMVGRTGGEAREAIEAAGLAVGVVTSRFDEEVAAEIVLEAAIDGVPAQPGAEFLTGTVIDLVVSAGPAPRQVPPVVGLTVEDARSVLAEQDLELATAEDYSETVAEGLIISATPQAGAEMARGSTVTATVSLGRPFVAVPDVVGQTIREAIDVLSAAGFTVEIDGDAAANVLATRPEPESSVRSGSTIEVISTIR